MSPSTKSLISIVSSIVVLFACCGILLNYTTKSEHSGRLRISVDTGANHLRSIVLRRFTSRLAENQFDAVETVLYESGQLGKDRDIPKALHWGNIDMGAPAQSKLTRFVPEANLYTLPILYGLPPEVMFSLLDGNVGRRINQTIENKLGVKVLGKSVILGFTSIYTTDKVISEPADLKNLKIRVPGGSGPIELFQQLGVSPLALPISDVPLALAQGSLNGIQSTHETVASAQLWEVGIKYCFEDQANLIIYVPLIGDAFWDSLSTKQQRQLTSAWDDVVSNGREFAIERQRRAGALLAEAGVQCIKPERDKIEQTRRQMAAVSQQLVSTLNIDQSLYEDMIAEVEVLINKQQKQ